MCDEQKLLQAVLSCNIRELEKSICSIKDVNFRVPNTYGLTLLHIAAGIPFHKSGPIVQFLLKTNADPNERSQDGLTPVHIAAMWDNIFVLEQLLFYGGNPFLKDYDGQDALDMALENNAKKSYRYLKSSKLDKEGLIALLKEEFSLRTNLKSFHSDIDLFNLDAICEDNVELSANNLNRDSFKVLNDGCLMSTNICEDSDSDATKELMSLVEGDTSSCDSFVSCTSNSPKTISSRIRGGRQLTKSSNRLSNYDAENTICKSPNYDAKDTMCKWLYSSAAGDSIYKFPSFSAEEDPSSSLSNSPVGDCSSELPNYATEDSNNGLANFVTADGLKSSDCLVAGHQTSSNFNKVRKWIKSVNCCKKPARSFSIDLLNAQLSSIVVGSGFDQSNDAITCISECSDNDIEITYADEIEGISLIEKRVLSLPPNSGTSSYDSDDYGSQCDWQFYKSTYSSPSFSIQCEEDIICIPEELQMLNNDEIFTQLKQLGDSPGPVMDYTRELYLRRLTELKFGVVSPVAEEVEKYPPEIYMFLSKELDMQKLQELEANFIAEIDIVASKGDCREGNQRCSFNYFLLDPRVTANLPLRISSMTPNEAFSVFLDALFYVGKGTRGRPYSHLYEAAKIAKEAKTAKTNDKVKHILDIWNSGQGVVSLHCFQNAIPIEAFTREACIIETIGLTNLTNIQKGNFYGQVAKWTKSKKRRLGVLLLHRAFQIFLQEGERLIRPKDIKR